MIARRRVIKIYFLFACMLFEAFEEFFINSDILSVLNKIFSVDFYRALVVLSILFSISIQATTF